jgi:formylglycine-generating enzyme required for sulfatase activity
MRAARLAPLVAALLALAGCWSVRTPGSAPDAGEGRDAGVDAGPTSDAGTDADIVGDAGFDGSINVDAGPTSDAGMSVDAGTGDCEFIDPPARSCPDGGPGCAVRVRVSAGTAGFAMGRDVPGYGERPVVADVRIAPFEIEVREVSVARFRAWVDAGAPTPTSTYPNGRTITPTSARFEMGRDCTFDGDPELPINCVNRDAALAFCAWDVLGGRLPTDAEREYVARWWRARPAETEGRVFPWGNIPALATVCTFANVMGCSGSTGLRPVGSLAPSFCLHDLAGNVAEWTADDFDDLRPACWGPGPAPWVSPLCVRPERGGTVRGGAWFDGDLDWTRTSARGAIDEASTRPADGFRCARNAGMPTP